MKITLSDSAREVLSSRLALLSGLIAELGSASAGLERGMVQSRELLAQVGSCDEDTLLENDSALDDFARAKLRLDLLGRRQSRLEETVTGIEDKLRKALDPVFNEIGEALGHIITLSVNRFAVSLKKTLGPGGRLAAANSPWVSKAVGFIRIDRYSARPDEEPAGKARHAVEVIEALLAGEVPGVPEGPPEAAVPVNALAVA